MILIMGGPEIFLRAGVFLRAQWNFKNPFSLPSEDFKTSLLSSNKYNPNLKHSLSEDNVAQIQRPAIYV